MTTGGRTVLVGFRKSRKTSSTLVPVSLSPLTLSEASASVNSEKCRKGIVMAVQVEFNGVKFIAESEDDLKRMWELAKTVAPPQQPPAVVVPPKIPKAPPRKREPPAAPASPSSGTLPATSDQLHTAKKYLSVIANAGGPSRADRLVEVFELGHGKALGPLSARVRQTLTALGFDPESVYRSIKIKNIRYWEAGSEMQRALEEIAGWLNVA